MALPVVFLVGFFLHLTNNSLKSSFSFQRADFGNTWGGWTGPGFKGEQVQDLLVGFRRPRAARLDFSSKTTACAIAAFSVPIPSGVLALIPILSPSIVRSFERLSRMAWTWGPIF